METTPIAPNNTIKNLTPHAVVVGDRSFPPSGTLARVAMVVTPCGEIDGVPLVSTTFGQVEGLPEIQAGVYFIVSSIVASAAAGRVDLLCPSGLVRDGEGKITGCQALSRNA